MKNFNNFTTMEKILWQTAAASWYNRYLIKCHQHQEYLGYSVGDCDETYMLMGLPDDSLDKCLENFIYDTCLELDCDCEYDIAIDIVSKSIITTIKTPDFVSICTIYSIQDCLIIEE